jgi:hypothetical protein
LGCPTFKALKGQCLFLIPLTHLYFYLSLFQSQKYRQNIQKQLHIGKKLEIVYSPGKTDSEKALSLLLRLTSSMDAAYKNQN